MNEERIADPKVLIEEAASIATCRAMVVRIVVRIRVGRNVVRRSMRRWGGILTKICVE